MTCPYLGQLGKDGELLPPEPHPSFAHRCLAVERLAPSQVDPEIVGLEHGDQILLGHQAATCLTPAYRHCPHYSLLHPEEPSHSRLEGTTAPMDGVLDLPSTAGPPGWLGLAGVLFALFLCAGSLAAYVGWQWVGRTLATLDQSAGPAAGGPGQVFLLVTATPPGQAGSPSSPTDTPTATATSTPEPLAEGDQTQGDEAAMTTPTPTPPPPAAPELATAVAEPVVVAPPPASPPNILLPPAGPAATPQPTVIVVTATPTPVYPTPSVVFRTAHKAVPPGECTTVFWEVENARAVFYENVGVQGKGQDRVCPRYVAETRTLSVLALDGTQQDYQVTVDLIIPTPTPTQTPTSTPVLTPTPTWTPEGTPTGTPAPIRFGVQLTVDGGNVRLCTPGEPCQAVIRVDNTGDLADEMFVNAANETPWPIRLCRPDGICGETVISLGVPAGGNLPVVLSVSVPQDAAPGDYRIRLQATSGNSGHVVRSEETVVLLRVEP